MDSTYRGPLLDSKLVRLRYAWYYRIKSTSGPSSALAALGTPQPSFSTLNAVEPRLTYPNLYLFFYLCSMYYYFLPVLYVLFFYLCSMYYYYFLPVLYVLFFYLCSCIIFHLCSMYYFSTCALCIIIFYLCSMYYFSPVLYVLLFFYIPMLYVLLSVLIYFLFLLLE